MTGKTQIKISEPTTEVSSDKPLYIALIAIVAIFLLAFILVKYVPSFEEEPLTLRELHQKTVSENLDTETAYMFNGHSFVLYDGVWYVEIFQGNAVYDVTLNYGPKDLMNISIEGNLSKEFLEKKQMYMTFDPNDNNLSHIAVSTFGLSNSLIKAFGITPVAGCTNTTVGACTTAPLITCDSENKSVFFFRYAEESKILFEDNCVIIEGNGEGIVKAKDRLLLRWYGLVE